MRPVNKERARWARRPLARGEGFQRLSRTKQGITQVRVQPGGYYVTGKPDEVLVAVLGSCVSACLRDPLSGLGGMNHFMLPESPSDQGEMGDEALRYGVHAMEVLINELLASGCPRNRLEVKLFGGADVGAHLQHARIGQRNTAFIRDYLVREGMAIAAEHLGGERPRRVHYYPAIGRIRMRELPAVEVEATGREEARLLQSLRQRRRQGDVELF